MQRKMNTHISYQLLRAMNCNVFSRVLDEDGINTIRCRYRVWRRCCFKSLIQIPFHSFRWTVNVFAGYPETVSMTMKLELSGWLTQNVLCSCLHVEYRYRYTLEINMNIEKSWIETVVFCTSHYCFCKSLLSHSKSALPNPWCYPLATQGWVILCQCISYNCTVQQAPEQEKKSFLLNPPQKNCNPLGNLICFGSGCHCHRLPSDVIKVDTFTRVYISFWNLWCFHAFRATLCSFSTFKTIVSKSFLRFIDL